MGLVVNGRSPTPDGVRGGDVGCIVETQSSAEIEKTEADPARILEIPPELRKKA